jgi:hypothetical protein
MDVIELQPESRTSKRTGQERSYTPGAGRVNDFLPEAQGAYGLKNHDTYSGLAHSLPNPPNQIHLPTDGGNDRHGNKTVSENPWGTMGSLNIAERQLSDNKFNRDITKDVYVPEMPFSQQHVKPTAWKQEDDEQRLMPLWYRKKMKK